MKKDKNLTPIDFFKDKENLNGPELPHLDEQWLRYKERLSTSSKYQEKTFKHKKYEWTDFSDGLNGAHHSGYRELKNDKTMICRIFENDENYPNGQYGLEIRDSSTSDMIDAGGYQTWVEAMNDGERYADNYFEKEKSARKQAYKDKLHQGIKGTSKPDKDKNLER